MGTGIEDKESVIRCKDCQFHKINVARMIQIKEILQNQGGRLSKIKE